MIWMQTLGMDSNTQLIMTMIKQISKVETLNANQVVLDIKANMDAVTPQTEGESIALDIARRVFPVFFDDIANGTTSKSFGGHDKDLLYCFAFFLSHDNEFKFTRTYLNDKSEAYILCVDKMRKAFSVMLSHFNKMVNTMDKDLQGNLLIYDEVFVFEYEKDKGRWVAHLLYNNLSCMVNGLKNVFQVYKQSNKKQPILIYTSELTGNIKEDKLNLKAILQS